MGKIEQYTLVLFEKGKIMKYFSLLLFLSIVLNSCMDKGFIVNGKTYQFDDVRIINSSGTNFFHTGSAVFTDTTVKISAGKINDTFIIESIDYNNTSDEKVAVFELSLNGDNCKAEFHQTDDNIIYLILIKNDYQDVVMLPCDNFIQIGKKYNFDSNSITKGYKMYVYDEGFAVFSHNSLTINVGNISKTYKIINSSFFKNEDSPNYRADFTLSIDGEECEAYFGVGETNRMLYIYFPKPSNEIQYLLSWSH